MRDVEQETESSRPTRINVIKGQWEAGLSNPLFWIFIGVEEADAMLPLVSTGGGGNIDHRGRDQSAIVTALYWYYRPVAETRAYFRSVLGNKTYLCLL